MYNYKKQTRSLIFIDKSTEGETIEKKVTRIVQNKEPIKDGSPLIYTERSEGVSPGYNIKTDRFELAAEAMDKVHRSRIAKRDAANKAMKNVADEVKQMKDSGAESTAGKADQNQSK